METQISAARARSPERHDRCFDESFLDSCDARIGELYGLWKSKCADGRLPSRRDIHPREMVVQLPNIMLVDVVRPGPRFRYALVGTGQVAQRGMDPTGKWLDEVRSGPDGSHCDGNYRYVVNTGSHLFDNSVEPTTLGNMAEAQAIFLPLAGDGKTVDTVMVYALIDMAREDNLRSTAGRRERHP
jgi:hypothetical protein